MGAIPKLVYFFFDFAYFRKYFPVSNGPIEDLISLAYVPK